MPQIPLRELKPELFENERVTDDEDGDENGEQIYYLDLFVYFLLRQDNLLKYISISTIYC